MKINPVNFSNMERKSSWLLAFLFFCACNSDTRPADISDKNSTAEQARNNSVVGNNYCDSVNSGLVTLDTLRGSPPRETMTSVNRTQVHIKYNSPGVKERIIWGGLVPYDKVWSTGAHNASRVWFSGDVMINDKKVTAGEYAFFTIPAKEKWVIILNTRYNQHLADDYNEKEDVIRVEVKPEEHRLTQRLTYAVNKKDERSGEIVMQWEKILVRLPFTTF